MISSKKLFFLFIFPALVALFANLLLAASKDSSHVGSPLKKSNLDSTRLQLVHAAHERTFHDVRYDGRYMALSYPGGDVPEDMGVCTDVVIRSYRKLGIDLQKLVHEDMQSNFDQYPSKRIWGLKRTDKNIDHRRVPNLRTFLKRNGETLKVTKIASDYRPGDLVTWKVPPNLPHIGIVSNKQSLDGKRPLIVHNIGAGPVLEDMLFHYKITGHYRYFPKNQ